MKTPELKFLLVLVAVAILAASALSQTTRIRFKRGAASAVVSGKMTGARGIRSWVIRVRDGQTLTTQQIGRRGGPITIVIKTPAGETYSDDMDASCHSRREVTPTAAGDYRITARECAKADWWQGPFSFRVSVR